MKPVFADTSYYVALLGPADSNHRLAVEWSEIVLGQIVVTEYILVELGSALAGLRDRHLYVPFVQELLADLGTEVIPASTDLYRQGLRLFAARADKDWSLVDCISFVIMKQRRLTEALSTDDHFNQAGFKALLK